MCYRRFLLYIYVSIIIYNEIKANEFSDLAKSVITKDLAVKLAQLVAEMNTQEESEEETLFYNNQQTDDENTPVHRNNENEEDEEEKKRRKSKKFDYVVNEIIRKVKDKIEQDLKTKYGLVEQGKKQKILEPDLVKMKPKPIRTEVKDKKNVPANPYLKHSTKKWYELEPTFVENSKKKKENIPDNGSNISPELKMNKPIDSYELEPAIAEQSVRIKEKKHDNDPSLPFKKIKMIKKHDSYEDYVTPARERHIFSSGELAIPAREEPPKKRKEERTNLREQKRKGLKMQSRFAVQSRMQTLPKIKYEQFEDIESTTSIYYDDEVPSQIEEEEIKARTETLGDYNMDDLPRKIGGTARPKKHYHTIISPNYYGKLSTVAEKYNFDEPLPEKDREDEKFKPIGNPPGSINGKVKLRKNKQGYFD